VLRDADAKRGRNKLLKASHMQGGIAEIVAMSGEKDYKERKMLLARMKKKSKANTKITTAKMIYVKEQSLMVHACLDLSREVSTMLEGLVALDFAARVGGAERASSGTYDDTAPRKVVDLVKDIVDGVDEQDKYAKGLSAQLRQMKEVIQSVAAQKRKGKATRKTHIKTTSKPMGVAVNGSENPKVCGEENRENGVNGVDSAEVPVPDPSSAVEAEFPPAAPMSEGSDTSVGAGTATGRREVVEMEMDSMVAQLLVSMRASHEAEGKRLNEEEAMLTKDVGVLRSRISIMLRNDGREEQDRQLREDLAMREDDTAETHLFMEDWFSRVKAVDDEHTDALTKLATAAAAAKSCMEEKLGSVWSDEERKTYAKVYHHAELVGYPRARLSAALQAQLPSKSHSELDAYETHLLSARNHARRKKELIQNYTHARQELLMSAKSALHKVRCEQREALERDREAQSRAAMTEKLHKELEVLRARAAEQQSIEDDARRIREAAEAEKRAQEEEERRGEFCRKRELVAAYRAVRRSQEEAAAARVKAAAQLEAERQREEVERARPNVERRQQLLEEKAKEEARKEALLQEEAKQRALFLQQLADSVKPDVESRLDDSTAAVKAQEYGGAPEQHRGHISLRGFTDESLFRDAKFRLGVYLHEAGVAQSVVSKAVVREWAPRPNAPLPTIW